MSLLNHICVCVSQFLCVYHCLHLTLYVCPCVFMCPCLATPVCLSLLVYVLVYAVCLNLCMCPCALLSVSPQYACVPHLDNSDTHDTPVHTAVGDDCRGMPGDVARRGLCFMEHTVLSCGAAVKVL